jgi:hypothetical protein
MKKIPSADKQYLNPEAQRGRTVLLFSGRVYECITSANEFLFAEWAHVSPWTQPFRYLSIRHKTLKAFK